MSDIRAWFAVVEGELGDQLWPSGLVVIDTMTDETEAHKEAKRLSALNLKHYRVMVIHELAIHCAPHVKVIRGEGLNPMPEAERAERIAGIREYLASLKKGPSQ